MINFDDRIFKMPRSASKGLRIGPEVTRLVTNFAFGHDDLVDVRSVSPVSVISHTSSKHIDQKDVYVYRLSMA